MPLTFPIGQAINRLFLTEHSPADTNLMLQLWDTYSGLPGLLSAVDVPTRKRTGYSYENGIYTDLKTGRAVSEFQLKNAVGRVSNEVRMRMRKETQKLLSGLVVLLAWYHIMRDLMRAFYRLVWLLSIGGLFFENDINRELFYLFVLSQFAFFDGLASRIESGQTVLDARLMEYAGMYGEYGQVMHQNLKLQTATQRGFTEGRRKLGNNENHCTDERRPTAGRRGCIELSRLGWLPLDQVTPLGAALCLDRCHCEIELR